MILDTGVVRELATFDSGRFGAHRLAQGAAITSAEERRLVADRCARSAGKVLASTALAVELHHWVRNAPADIRLLWRVIRNLYDEFAIREQCVYLADLDPKLLVRFGAADAGVIHLAQKLAPGAMVLTTDGPLAGYLGKNSVGFLLRELPYLDF